MTDIVERLLEHVDYLPREVRQEAADEIERLTAIAENAEALRRNLEDVSCRQQAEIDRLRGIEQFVAEAARHERDGLRAEIERLRRLHADLRDNGIIR